MLCPLCNGLQELDARCPLCRSELEDGGRPSDWSGPYAPYMPDAEPLGSAPSSSAAACTHLAYCAGCDYWCELSIAAEANGR